MKLTIDSLTEQCKKCGSYMCFQNEKNGRPIHRCKDCGYVKYDNPKWYERLMFWKY